MVTFTGIRSRRGWSHCAMDGSSFTTQSETPCADPHAGCCGEVGLDTLPYPMYAQHGEELMG